MTKVRKAVITAAGRGTRMYPASNTVQKELFPLVDVDGFAKPTLQIIMEEALASGVEELCIVANEANIGPMKQHFHGLSAAQKSGSFAGKEWALSLSDTLDDIASRVTFVVQTAQEGYGHAVYQAREWVGDDPFVLLLGDHVYISRSDLKCARQVIETYEQNGCAVSSVARTPEAVIHRYGTIGGRKISEGNSAVYEITAMVEKPTLEMARQTLRTPGVPDGEYLCFFGIHVFPPTLFHYLARLIDNNIRQKGEIQLTSAQEMLFQNERYLAGEVQGTRYDMGVPEGLVETQIALALHSPFRHEAKELLKTL